MTRLLITGASGLLGSNLVLEAVAAGHQVVAVSYRHAVRHPKVASVTADLSHPGEAQRILGDWRPGWVVHCAAATDVDACEVEPAKAFRLNRDMAGQVAMAARAAGARLVHVSTDAVFDGERGKYTEDDEPHPINVYGDSKLAGERVVLAEYPGALVVRTCIYGWNAQPKQCLSEWFLSRLRAGQEAPGFIDAWFSPILVKDLGEIVLRLLSEGKAGIWHVGGRDCLSKFDFGVLIAQVFGRDPHLIKPEEMQGSRLRACRGRHLCLQSSRVAALDGVQLPRVSDGLRRWKRQERDGTTRELRRLVGSEEGACNQDV